jgi:hypothetical protein
LRSNEPQSLPLVRLTSHGVLPPGTEGKPRFDASAFAAIGA